MGIPCIGSGHEAGGDMFAGLSRATMLEFFPDEYRRRLRKVKKTTKRKSTKRKSTKSKSKSKKPKAKRK